MSKSDFICELGFATEFFGKKAFCFTMLKKLHLPFPAGIALSPELISLFIKNQQQRKSIMEKICSRLREYGSLAVRSSSLEEDGTALSFAGVFESVLNVNNDVEELELAILKVIESGQSYFAKIYSGKTSINMGIIIQQMISAKLSGVAFTEAISEKGRRVCLMNLVEGLGDALNQRVSLTSSIVIPYINDMLSIESIMYTGAPIDLSMLKKIFVFLVQLIISDPNPLDVEWCVDAMGNSYILQIRPITRLVLLQNSENRNGLVASYGIAKGKAFVIENGTGGVELEKQIEKCPQNSILVSPYIDTQYYPCLLKASGIITDDGSLINHASIVAREKHLPCLISAGYLCEKIKQDDYIEINTYSKEIKINNITFSISSGGIDWADIYYFENMYGIKIYDHIVLLEPTYEGPVIYTSPLLEDKDKDRIECESRKLFSCSVRIYSKDKYYWYFENQRFKKFFHYDSIYRAGIEIVDRMDSEQLNSYYTTCLQLAELFVRLRQKLENPILLFAVDEMLLSLYFIVDMRLAQGYGFMKVYYALIPVLMKEGVQFSELIINCASYHCTTEELNVINFYHKLSILRDKIASSFLEMGAYRFNYFDDREQRANRLFPHKKFVVAIDDFYQIVHSLNTMLIGYDEFKEIKKIIDDLQ